MTTPAGQKLVSIHRMLDYEVGRDDPSPETVCQKVDVWRLLDREVPETKFDTDFTHSAGESTSAKKSKQSKSPSKMQLNTSKQQSSYDPSNLSMEQVQDWILATCNILSKDKPISKRPQMIIKNPRLYWSDKRKADLLKARTQAGVRFR